MPLTVLVEPNPDGHRFQAVAHVAAVAAESAGVLLLTSTGASDTEEFAVFLADSPIRVVESFSSVAPPTSDVVAAVIDLVGTEDVTTVVHMDADPHLKRWWYLAPRGFRGLPKPRVVFFLTRYPTRLRLSDTHGWKIRIGKASLAVAARATGTLHHVAGFAGRDDLADGWIVHRARDPAICTAHARDRDLLRQELGLPTDRRLVGIFGEVGPRKNADLVLESLLVADVDADLLLAGPVAEKVHAWVRGLSPLHRQRVIVRDGFHSSDLLDKYVAASDVAPIAITLNGPSGIMGKALVAGVPVVTAGSKVRARELIATGGGEVAELTPSSIGGAIRRVLATDSTANRNMKVPLATADEFSRALLGVGPQGQVRGRGPRRHPQR